MAAKIESAVVIARPVEEVFAFVLNLEKNATRMDPDIESAEKTSEGPVGAGTTFRLRGRSLGRRRDMTVRFREVEPNRRIDSEARIGPIAPRMSWTFEEAEGGTSVTVGGDANPVGLFKLLSGPIRRAGQRVWDGRLARMKEALEAPSSGSAGHSE